MVTPADIKQFLKLLFEKKYGLLIVLILIGIAISIGWDHVFQPTGSGGETIYLGTTSPNRSQ
ncbi:MAG: hypothetical protein V4644_01660 [Patescibacteria group bacterium]